MKEKICLITGATSGIGKEIAIALAKLANILFTKHLSHLLKDTGVTVNCLLPGQAITNLIKDGNSAFYILLRFVKSLNLKRLSAERAAQTPVFLATSPDIENITGECFKKGKIIQTSIESCNMDIAKRLWEVSTEYVKGYINFKGN